MNPVWLSVILSALATALVALAVGVVANAYWALGVWVLLAGLLTLHHARQLARLIDWAEQPIGASVPDAGGAWGQAFAALHRRSRLAAQLRRELEEALERQLAAAQALPEGVLILSDSFLIEWMNTRAEKDLGLSSSQDLGAPLTNLVREPELVRYLESGGGEALTIRCSRNPGHTLQLQTVPFGAGRHLLLTRDVTQIERLETTRRDFVANVSHELKTPLTVVAGFVETLRDGAGDISAEEARSYLDLALEQARRMQRLIEDLLTLSGLETGVLPSVEERVDMHALLAAVVDEARVLSAGRHDISLDDRGPPCLHAAATELQSALGNLASNAVRYTPEGGRITVSWSARPDGGAECTVTDTGIGIEARHVPRLTERFYRVDRGRSREMGGTGLGLAIVKHVLERHQARLEIETRPGQGSTFRAVFPAARVAV